MEYSYGDLVDRVIDLEKLAEMPPAGEKTAQASSYDRASQYDVEHDQYIAWDANGDGGGIVRKEGDVSVWMDVKGPGCIWRIWTAAPNEGHVKIYLDGAEVPVVDLSFQNYFSHKADFFRYPALAYRNRGNGFNNFIPIPFQKSCKIVAEKNWGAYYQVNYSQFPAGTVVPTFHLPLTPAEDKALEHANGVLANSGKPPYAAKSGSAIESKKISAQAGKSTVVYDADGPAAITGIRIKFDIPADAEAQRNLLRQLALRMTWDKQSQPAVWSPIGDFFGNPGGAVPFRSLTSGLGEDGYWYCYWYMPFGSHATIAVDNDSSADVPMEWEITRSKLDQPAESLLRFHAKWHRDAFLPESKDRKVDWTLLKTTGKGRYVGTQLQLWHPRGCWWGEGDEKFFIDNEKFPSTFGTGSEDYFGFAWCASQVFSEPLQGQPYTKNSGRIFGRGEKERFFDGYFSAYRWHISDSLPFQTSFEGCIEKYFPNEMPTLYAAVAFWYLDAAGKDPYPDVPVSERIGYMHLPPVYHEPGAIEAEVFQLVKPNPDIANGWTWVHGAESHGTPMNDKGLPPDVVSNDSYFRLLVTKVGGKFEVTGLKTETAGKFKVIARFLKTQGSGIFQASIDNVAIGGPVDLFYGQSRIAVADPIELGTVELTKGAHSLSFELVDKNAQTKKDPHGFEFCLDYLKLIPVP